MLLPSALGSSPHPPVSVYGTGAAQAIAAFPGTAFWVFATCIPLLSRHCLLTGAFPPVRLLRFHRSSQSRLPFGPCVPTFLLCCSTGISTCCPSDTRFRLSLGPDLPGADQLYPGILGYSAVRILTLLSLLIPAFSLQYSPQFLADTASSCIQCSSTDVLSHIPKLRCRVLAPDIFGAGPLD